MRFVQGVEGMKKLFLGPLLAGNELHIVDQQDVHGAKFVAKVVHFRVADPVDQFVHEFFGSIIADAQLRIACQHGVADGIDQMGFAETDAAIDK